MSEWWTGYIYGLFTPIVLVILWAGWLAWQGELIGDDQNDIRWS